MSRTILITGATGKLGHIFVGYFLTAGDNVIAAGRSKEKLNHLKVSCPQKRGQLHLLEIDLLDEQMGDLIVEKLSRLKLRPDCLINNARNLDFCQLDTQGKASSENFLNEFKLDVVIPYELIMALINYQGCRLRSIANVGSIYGSVAPNLKLYTNADQQSPIQYGVAKAALSHLTKELAVRLADKDIRVNCVAYGGVEGLVDKAFKQRYSKLCPAGRMLNESDIAGPIDMLLSEAASGITGHTLMVDGGWSAW